jgi:hypothetical protein
MSNHKKAQKPVGMSELEAYDVGVVESKGQELAEPDAKAVGTWSVNKASEALQGVDTLNLSKALGMACTAILTLWVHLFGEFESYASRLCKCATKTKAGVWLWDSERGRNYGLETLWILVRVLRGISELPDKSLLDVVTRRKIAVDLAKNTSTWPCYIRVFESKSADKKNVWPNGQTVDDVKKTWTGLAPDKFVALPKTAIWDMASSEAKFTETEIKKIESDAARSAFVASFPTLLKERIKEYAGETEWNSLFAAAVRLADAQATWNLRAIIRAHKGDTTDTIYYARVIDGMMDAADKIGILPAVVAGLKARDLKKAEKKAEEKKAEMDAKADMAADK